MSFTPLRKGTLPFGDLYTWYRITGDMDAGRLPVVVVHGGPGSTHDYLLNVCRLAEEGWPVVHYDQIGNGGSSRLSDGDTDALTVGLFLDELDNLLGGLRIADGYVLFGQSWGGMLCAAHAAAGPKGLRGLVIANAPASYRLWRQEMEVLRRQLPPEAESALRRHEEAGTTQSAEYLAALRVFYARHVCRLDPWPRDLVASLMEIQNDPTIYHTMNGPNEFHVTGRLRDWSVVEDLHRIAVPTLMISGRHDEATPATMQPYHDRIPDVRWAVFDESSHVPHLEEPERFTEVLVDFLAALK